MPLENYSRTCAKNLPGNYAEIYIAPMSAVTSVTEASGEIDAVTATDDGFKKLQADIDTVQFTYEGVGGTTYSETQNLIAKFSIPSKNLTIMQDEIAKLMPCGVAVIRVDNNRKVWISGVSTVAKEGKSRPYNKVQFEFDSGLVGTDEGTQSVTMTLTRVGKYGETIFDATQTTAVIDGAGAAYIDW